MFLPTVLRLSPSLACKHNLYTTGRKVNVFAVGSQPRLERAWRGLASHGLPRVAFQWLALQWRVGQGQVECLSTCLTQADTKAELSIIVVGDSSITALQDCENPWDGNLITVKSRTDQWVLEFRMAWHMWHIGRPKILTTNCSNFPAGFQCLWTLMRRTRECRAESPTKWVQQSLHRGWSKATNGRPGSRLPANPGNGSFILPQNWGKATWNWWFWLDCRFTSQYCIARRLFESFWPVGHGACLMCTFSTSSSLLQVWHFWPTAIHWIQDMGVLIHGRCSGFMAIMII